MPWDLSPFADVGLSAALLQTLLGEHETDVRPGLEKLWSYYRNPGVLRRAAVRLAGGGGPGVFEAGGPIAHTLAQSAGLPDRLRTQADRRTPQEIVIENDIGWRVDALVDMAFGRWPRITSAASSPEQRLLIDAALSACWDAAGGVSLLQDIGLLGSVYGWIDLVVRDAGSGLKRSGKPAPTPESVAQAGRRVRIEPVAATRAIPLLDPGDYRRILAYIIHAKRVTNEPATPGVFERLWSRVRPGADERWPAATSRHVGEAIEVCSSSHRQVYEDGALVLDEAHGLGELPVVHIQNTSQPYRFEGRSDVEPLIPLQDELNTRLSDRAHRVTLQSFNMYLAKGIDFGRAPSADGLRVGPGQLWLTDNPDADVKAFGGDGHSPSEDRHIDELREALDKASGVSPVVIGVIREKLGHLSSENAIRITLSGILSKVARKRQSYGRGIEHASRLVLAALNASGALPSAASDRGVRLEWADPLPIDEKTRLSTALLKRDLGVPTERILQELGYAERSAV